MIQKRIHTIYSILLSIAAVVAGICLIAACISIYHSGDRPFSPEAVQAAFGTIAVPVYLCLALAAGGFVLDGLAPLPRKKASPEKQEAVILEKLQAKTGLIHIRSRQQRRLHKTVTLVLLALGGLVFFSYGLNAANFDSRDITGSMIKAMYVLLPCLVVPFGYGVFTAYFCRNSIRREIGYLRSENPEGCGSLPAKKAARRHFPAVRWVLLGVGIFCLVYGFVAGGTEDVLTKAVNICTECVGLG